MLGRVYRSPATATPLLWDTLNLTMDNTVTQRNRRPGRQGDFTRMALFPEDNYG